MLQVCNDGSDIWGRRRTPSPNLQSPPNINQPVFFFWGEMRRSLDWLSAVLCSLQIFFLSGLYLSHHLTSFVICISFPFLHSIPSAKPNFPLIIKMEQSNAPWNSPIWWLSSWGNPFVYHIKVFDAVLFGKGYILCFLLQHTFSVRKSVCVTWIFLINLRAFCICFYSYHRHGEPFHIWYGIPLNSEHAFSFLNLTAEMVFFDLFGTNAIISANYFLDCDEKSSRWHQASGEVLIYFVFYVSHLLKDDHLTVQTKENKRLWIWEIMKKQNIQIRKYKHTLNFG